MENTVRITLIDTIKLPELNNIEIILEKIEIDEISTLSNENIVLGYVNATIYDSEGKVKFSAKGKDIQAAITNIGKLITSTMLSKVYEYTYIK